MDYYNLTTPQKNIWNLQKYYDNTSIGNLCGAIFYKEKRDNNLLKKAIYKFVDNQSGLCMRFAEKEEPVQYIRKELEDIPVMTFDTLNDFDKYAESFAKQPVGLNDRVMYRFVVFRVGDRSGVLAVLSHLISDAWTFGLMAAQVDEVYHNLADGTNYDIWKADYTEYVQTEKDYFISERYQKDKLYWENKYTAQPEKSIIKMLPAKSDSIAAKRFTKCVSAELENKINKYCSTHQVTSAVLFETALITYLAKINAEKTTITIGIPVLNRSNAKEKKIAGMFVSTMPLTVEVKEDMTITELTQQISKGHMEIFRHQKYPYSDILKYLREKQNFSGNLYDVMISYQNAKTNTDAETKWYSNGYSEVPFVMHIDNRDGKNTHTINIDYQLAVFKDKREIEYVVSRLEYILIQIIDEISKRINEINIVPQVETNMIIEEFNDTYVEYKDYFKKQLKCDFEPVVLPATKNPVGKGCSKVYQISKTTVSVAKNYARKHNLTDTMVFWGAYGILLSKYSGNNSVLSSIVLKNRIYTDTKDMTGMFVNTLPAYMEVSGSVSKYMQRIKQQILGLFEHQELPFALIADTVGMKDKNVINTSFVYQADGDKGFTIGEETIVPEPLSTNTSKFGLMMEVTPVEDELEARMEFDGTKYDELLMDRLVATYERILEQLDKEDMSEIEIMSPEEYHKVVEEFNDTYVEYPREKCVHELFMAQARRTPEKIALVSGNKKYTYQEVDKKSDAIAQRLINLGVKKRDVVGAYLDRTAYTVISQLAVLKAGGVFLPIDNRYPEDRIDYMLNDCAVKLVLTDKEFSDDWNVDYYNLGNYQFDDTLNEIVKVEPDDECYVIYTSGSTGKPKGCVLMQKGLTNFCANNNIIPYAETLQHQTVVSVNTISFDFFIAETLLPLSHGWTVVLASEEESNNKELFKELVKDNNVNIIETTPTRLELYTKDETGKDSYFQKIQLVASSGEALTEVLLQKIRNISQAKVFNPLGPSECSVWNVGGDFKDYITIGSPIANTQIYILDKNNRPLPIGVLGELCIAGEGVGKGYLNRPELTAEKFVPNPFATAENHHGKIMYHTGDLACWKSDGEIEYLGRIDTQVKIRGLRIELGEIENVMSSFTGIQLTAVADKRDENNRQYLVGYYTSERQIDEKELRNYLSSKLPKYMIPNYFMRLDTMLMTASGKTDRKNLPVPDFSMLEREYVAPETEMEINLCKLLGEILHIEKVGVKDDFFDNGGDSLAAIEYVAKAHGIGVEMSLQNVFDYPTVRSLCDFLQVEKNEKVQYKETDFDKYKQIFDRNVINERGIFKKKSLGNVLLTGATGFLGAHVLNELMQKEQGKIYCLVRSDKANDRRGRLNEILKYYFGDMYESEINKRIVPIIGDIEQEGLSDEMPTDVQTVIHTAASVKHYGSYSYFNRVNTEGTAHVIEYAKKVGAKLIHISTISVSGNSMADDFSVYRSDEEKFFYETSLYIGQPLDNVYIHSKFEAERKVYDAMLEGLDAKVIRVGNLTNRASDYKFQPNYTSNAFLTRVKAILEFGLFPDYLMNLYAEFSPIDKTAEGIIKIARYADKQCVFHLNSDKVIYFNHFLEIVHKLGISMEVVSGAEFNKALQETIKQRNTEYIFEAFQNDMDEKGILVYDSNIRIKNDFTLRFLKKIGFEWNETDMEYIGGYVNYFRKIGYLEV